MAAHRSLPLRPGRQHHPGPGQHPHRRRLPHHLRSGPDRFVKTGLGWPLALLLTHFGSTSTALQSSYSEAYQLPSEVTGMDASVWTERLTSNSDSSGTASDLGGASHELQGMGRP